MTNAGIVMEEGVLYRIIYKAESGNRRWYEWELTAVFLERTREGRVMLSFRPLAGTSDLLGVDILRVERVEGERLDRGNSGVKLPKKLGPLNV